MSQCPGVLDRREETGEAGDEVFTSADMTRAINTSEPTSPGVDMICYVRLKHLVIKAAATSYQHMERGKITKLQSNSTNIRCVRNHVEDDNTEVIM